MNKFLTVLSLTAVLSACAEAPAIAESHFNNAYSMGSLGGASLTQSDREKVGHALDNPIGKITQWTNRSTGVNYTVVATEKITINSNPICRRYKVTSEKNKRVQVSTYAACIDHSTGTWQPAF